MKRKDPNKDGVCVVCAVEERERESQVVLTCLCVYGFPWRMVHTQPPSIDQVETSGWLSLSIRGTEHSGLLAPHAHMV